MFGTPLPHLSLTRQFCTVWGCPGVAMIQAKPTINCPKKEFCNDRKEAINQEGYPKEELDERETEIG